MILDIRLRWLEKRAQEGEAVVAYCEHKPEEDRLECHAASITASEVELFLYMRSGASEERRTVAKLPLKAGGDLVEKIRQATTIEEFLYAYDLLLDVAEGKGEGEAEVEEGGGAPES